MYMLIWHETYQVSRASISLSWGCLVGGFVQCFWFYGSCCAKTVVNVVSFTLTSQEKFRGIMSGHLGGQPLGSSEPLRLPGILFVNFCTIVQQHLVGSMLLVKIPCLWPVVHFWRVEISVLIHCGPCKMKCHTTALCNSLWWVLIMLGKIVTGETTRS